MTAPLRNFSSLLAVITEAGTGLMGFRRYIERARDAALADPHAGAAWLLLMVAAEQFTHGRFEEPVTVEDSQEALEGLQIISATLDEQFVGADPNSRLHALNSAAKMVVGLKP